MIRAFKLPDIGEGVHEGEIRQVLVAPGDTVALEQPILEVETDKVTVEITSPFAGRIHEVRFKPGQVAQVGDVLITFDVPEIEPSGTTAAGAGPVAPALAAPVDVPAPAPLGGAERRGPVPATPATRRLARELSVDLAQVTPGGPGGRVTAEDVRAHAAAQTAAAGRQHTLAPPAVRARRTGPAAGQEPVGIEQTGVVPANDQTAAGPAPARPGSEMPAARAAPLPDHAAGPVERVPLSPLRRAAARHLAESWRQIPHVHHQDVADVTALEAYRLRYRAEIAEQGGKLTLTVFVLKAVVVALKAFPNLNASFDADREELLLKRYYHIGVATETERGLLVPVVRDADRKSIAVLAVEMARLAERVRAGGADLEDLRGGTFTVTNIGALGGTGATPIINYPEVAILGLGAAQLQPVVVQSASDEAVGAPQIQPRLMLPLFLGFDHRVASGMEAARFTRRVIEILEQPDKLALWL